MEAKRHPLLSWRGLVIMMMMGLFLTFTSAETRANVMMKLAEENGVGRFYEDKSHAAHQEVVRLAQAQGSRDPEELPHGARSSRMLAPAPTFTTRARAAATPRGPPHGPRAPPAVA